jgi:hypothetical protein
MTLFALPQLYLDIKARFAADGLGASVVFGWREPTKRTNQGTGRALRVCIVPGVKGKAGQYAPARNPGRVLPDGPERSLRTFLELAEVYCWGCDNTSPALASDELAQYEAARRLHDAVVRAIYLSPNVGHGAFKISDPSWVIENVNERRFGAELKFTLEVQALIPDQPYGTADAPATFTGPPTEINIANAATFPAGDASDGTDNVEGDS